MKHILQHTCISIQRIAWFEPTYYVRELCSGQGRFVDALRHIARAGVCFVPHLLGLDVWVTTKLRRLSHLGSLGLSHLCY